MASKSGGEWVRGSLDLMVLSVVAEEPRYGYLIQQRLGEASGGRVRPQAGTLYPLLHRLEADGLIRSRWDKTTGRKRKWYELTAAGRRQLGRQARQWVELADCLRQLLAPVLDAQPKTT